MRPIRYASGDKITAGELNKVGEASIQRLSVPGATVRRVGSSICVDLPQQFSGGPVYAKFDAYRWQNDSPPTAHISGALGDATYTGLLYTGHALNTSTGNADSSAPVQFQILNDPGEDTIITLNNLVILVPVYDKINTLTTNWMANSTYGSRYYAISWGPWGAWGV